MQDEGINYKVIRRTTGTDECEPKKPQTGLNFEHNSAIQP